MGHRLTFRILLAMLAGVAVGAVVHLFAAADAARIARWCQLPADIFLHLIKMIVAPLVLSTLIAGIAHMRDGAALGRIGLRAMVWFLAASLVSLALGLFFVNWLAPGVGLNLSVVGSAAPIATPPIDAPAFILHMVPTSLVQAMAENSILQIVIFALFAGFALAGLGDRGTPLVALVDSVVDLMLRITDIVMRTAPIAVFASLAALVAREGVGLLPRFAVLIADFYLALAALWLLLLGAGSIFLGTAVIRLIRVIRDPLLLAFATASSEAAYPRMLEQLERFGVPRPLASFVLPLGYSFNLDGSMIYSAFATIFIAQAYGITLPIETQVTMLLVLLITSKGMAAVPRGALVVVTAALTQFNLPVEGVALIMAIDHLLDMGRTCTNVLGNAIASAVIAKGEPSSMGS